MSTMHCAGGAKPADKQGIHLDQHLCVQKDYREENTRELPITDINLTGKKWDEVNG
jgi:hypothetical protein